MRERKIKIKKFKLPFRFNKKTVAGVLVVGALIALLAGYFLRGDDMVEFRTLSEAEIPQDIAGQVIPEYRDLERALACVVDDKIYVVVTRGEKLTSGYEIAIEKLECEEENGQQNLIVHALFKDPEPGTALSQVLTYPLAVAETGLEELPDTIELRIQY